jgi:hypothetical protein
MCLKDAVRWSSHCCGNPSKVFCRFISRTVANSRCKELCATKGQAEAVQYFGCFETWQGFGRRPLKKYCHILMSRNMPIRCSSLPAQPSHYQFIKATVYLFNCSIRFEPDENPSGSKHIAVTLLQMEMR